MTNVDVTTVDPTTKVAILQNQNSIGTREDTCISESDSAISTKLNLYFGVLKPKFSQAAYDCMLKDKLTADSAQVKDCARCIRWMFQHRRSDPNLIVWMNRYRIDSSVLEG